MQMVLFRMGQRNQFLQYGSEEVNNSVLFFYPGFQSEYVKFSLYHVTYLNPEMDSLYSAKFSSKCVSNFVRICIHRDKMPFEPN